MEFLESLRPRGLAPEEWGQQLEGALRGRRRMGPAWEEMVTGWAALYALVARCHASSSGGGGSGGGTAAATATAGAASSSLAPAAPAGAALADGSDVPSLVDYLLELKDLDGSPELQLDYIATLMPEHVEEEEWEARVAGVVWLSAYLRAISRQYTPVGCFWGQTMQTYARGTEQHESSVRDFVAGWAAGYSAPIARYVQPLQLVAWPPAAAAGAAQEAVADGSIGAAVASAAAAAAAALEQRLAAAKAVHAQAQSARRALVQASYVGLLPSSGAVDAVSRGGDSAGEDSSANVLLSALNALCPAGSQASGSGGSVSSSHMVAAAAAAGGGGGFAFSLPAWLLHDETASSGSLARELAGKLPMPAYGVSMAHGAEGRLSSLHDLAER